MLRRIQASSSGTYVRHCDISFPAHGMVVGQRHNNRQEDAHPLPTGARIAMQLIVYPSSHVAAPARPITGPEGYGAFTPLPSCPPFQSRSERDTFTMPVSVARVPCSMQRCQRWQKAEKRRADGSTSGHASAAAWQERPALPSASTTPKPPQRRINNKDCLCRE